MVPRYVWYFIQARGNWALPMSLQAIYLFTSRGGMDNVTRCVHTANSVELCSQKTAQDFLRKARVNKQSDSPWRVRFEGLFLSHISILCWSFARLPGSSDVVKHIHSPSYISYRLSQPSMQDSLWPWPIFDCWGLWSKNAWPDSYWEVPVGSWILSRMKAQRVFECENWWQPHIGTSSLAQLQEKPRCENWLSNSICTFLLQYSAVTVRLVFWFNCLHLWSGFAGAIKAQEHANLLWAYAEAWLIISLILWPPMQYIKLHLEQLHPCLDLDDVMPFHSV